MKALAKLIERSVREPEDWRYTDVQKLLKAAPVVPAASAAQDLPCITGKEAQRIVFANGALQADQSRIDDLPKDFLAGDVTEGYRLSLAAQSCLVTAPIELVFAGKGEAETAVNLSIDIGANASLTIIEHHLSSGTGAQVVETTIKLGAQAKLVHEKIVHDLHAAAHFSRTQVQVGDGAYYRNFALIKDTRLLRHEVDVTLAGPLAQCDLSGALLLQGREHADVQTRIHHAAPHGTSRQLYKAVLKDQSRGVFQGRIKVLEGAQKTDGQQLCRALLLSDQAEMDAKPELEIYADDVACSHGCAIGDLDLEAMFYLRSRGLNENQARALLLRAFIDETLDAIQVEDVRAYLQDKVGGWLNEQA